MSLFVLEAWKHLFLHLILSALPCRTFRNDLRAFAQRIAVSLSEALQNETKSKLKI